MRSWPAVAARWETEATTLTVVLIVEPLDRVDHRLRELVFRPSEVRIPREELEDAIDPERLRYHHVDKALADVVRRLKSLRHLNALYFDEEAHCWRMCLTEEQEAAWRLGLNIFDQNP